MNSKIHGRIVLPRIQNKIRELDYQNDDLLVETLEFLRGRTRRVQEMYNPYMLNNYNIYPKNYGDFYHNYPHSMPYYRPIRYFFQRPVNLTAESAFPEQKKYIQQIIQNNEAVKSSTKNKKWGKPVRMDDLIKAGEEIHYPIAKLIPPSELRKKQQEIENLRIQHDQFDPEKRRLIRQKNKRVWELIRKMRHFVKFYSVIKEYTFASQAYKKSKDLIQQANKADITDLTKFIFEKIKGIEDMAIDIFPQILVYDKTLQMKTEDSVFKIKTFIHKLFHDLQTGIALKEDIPDYVKKIILNYILNGKYFPENFLTTFEFNRLEFDLHLKTSKMDNDRRAMVACFIVLYRVLILEILKNFPKYFVKLGKMKKKETNTVDSENNYKKTTITSKKDEVKENVKYNINFIITVLHYILKDAFVNTPKIYREYFKDSHLFKKLVIDGETFSSLNSIGEKLKKDEIELANILKLNSKAQDFVKENFRWVTMYKMTAFSFCLQLVENVLST